MLVDASTGSDLRVLSTTNTISFATDGSSLNIRADTSGLIGSIGFILDGLLFRTENTAPYYLAGDVSGVVNPWTPALGNHQLIVTPYSGSNRSGKVGTAIAISFTVTGLTPPPPPTDTRPLNYISPTHTFVGPNIPPRVQPYTLGTPNGDYGDFWSDSGQLAYVPDGTITADPGLAATASFAYYRGVFATQPRFDAYRGIPNPDPSTRNSVYITGNGGPMSGVVAQVRATNTASGCALVLWQDGLLTAASTQTGHGSVQWPWLKLPSNKIPYDLAVTSNNELAIIALYDNISNTGQLAVVMLEGAGIPFQTFTEKGLFNQASFSEFQLLGYVDLPFNGPFKVSATSNGYWGGPSATGGFSLGQLDLTSTTIRNNIYSGAWKAVIADSGYAVVSSKTENKIVVMDLSPLFHYIRESWLSSDASYAQTFADEATGVWPKTFAQMPSLVPTLAYTQSIPAPVSVIAGHHIDRFSHDRFKFHVGLEAGDIVIFDASKIMARFSWETKSTTINEMGRFFVGQNPCSMAFSRRNEGQGSSIFLPSTTQKGDGQNNCIWVTCRGSKQVVEILTVGGKAIVLKTISDQRMNDPVNVVVCVRGYIVLVCDYAGKKLFGFRWGNITDNRQTPSVTYAPGATGLAAYEISGILDIPGNPFMVTSDNVN